MYKNKEQRRINAAVKTEHKSSVLVAEVVIPSTESSNGSQGKTHSVQQRPKKRLSPPKKNHYKLMKSDSVGNCSDVSVTELR